jgi:hypothetical protein
VIAEPARLLERAELEPGSGPLQLVHHLTEQAAGLAALVTPGRQAPVPEPGSGIDLHEQPGSGAADDVTLLSKQHLQPGGPHRRDADPVRGHAQRDHLQRAADVLVGVPVGE